jgi:hypothetical protein
MYVSVFACNWLLAAIKHFDKWTELNYYYLTCLFHDTASVADYVLFNDKNYDSERWISENREGDNRGLFQGNNLAFSIRD